MPKDLKSQLEFAAHWSLFNGICLYNYFNNACIELGMISNLEMI